MVSGMRLPLQAPATSLPEIGSRLGLAPTIVVHRTRTTDSGFDPIGGVRIAGQLRVAFETWNRPKRSPPMTRCIVVRHGIAEIDSQTGRDADRALSAVGRERTAQVAAALVAIEIVPRRLVSSPLLRARQTAAIFADACGITSEIAICEALAPDGDPQAILMELRRLGDLDHAAFFGHLPSAAWWVAAAIGAARDDAIELRKAGVAVVDFPGAIALGRGTLSFLLQPKALLRDGSRG
jgi:phosphohistidine phosphatase